MLSLDDRPILKVVLNNYPLPIALALKEKLLEKKEPELQARGLYELANALLQYTALIAASNYATVSFKSERVSNKFERLKSPSDSAFPEFLQISVPFIKEQNSLFVPELAEILENKLEGKDVNRLEMSERGLVKREKLPLLKAFVAFRNSVEHRKLLGRWEEVIEHYLPPLCDLLEIMEWCSRYPLLRLVDDNKR